MAKKKKQNKTKIEVSQETYNDVESATMLLAKLDYPLDLFDDLWKIHLKK